jgi:uncharacterized integral membrane protein
VFFLRVFYWLITVFIVIFVVSFAANNGEPVALNLWPFRYELKAPLFFLLFCFFFIGVALGALLSWISCQLQSSYKKNSEPD